MLPEGNDGVTCRAWATTSSFSRAPLLSEAPSGKEFFLTETPVIIYQLKEIMGEGGLPGEGGGDRVLICFQN